MESNLTQSLLVSYNEGSLSKERVLEVVRHFCDQLEDGHVNPLEALAQLEWLSQVVDGIKSKARQLSVDELSRYGDEAKQGVKKYGVTLKLKEAGVKYSFDHVDLWSTMKLKEDSVSQKRKDLENMMKSINKPTSFINHDTGEVHELFPARKTSTTTVEVSLKK